MLRLRKEAKIYVTDKNYRFHWMTYVKGKERKKQKVIMTKVALSKGQDMKVRKSSSLNDRIPASHNWRAHSKTIHEATACTSLIIMQSTATDLGWAGWVFTTPTQILENHAWMFSAVLIMSRLEEKRIQAPLNQDIKAPFAVFRLPESSSDFSLQMVTWQTILLKDTQDTETHSGPLRETAVWKQLRGPFCVKFKLLLHTLTGG